MIKWVLSFIYAHLFWCIISNDKQPNVQIDKKKTKKNKKKKKHVKFLFYNGLHRILVEKILLYIKISDLNVQK